MSASEPVAHAGFGQQVARMRRVRLRLAPQLGREDLQVVELGGVRRTPDVAQQELELFSLRRDRS
jgi:hypothetical protein